MKKRFLKKLVSFTLAVTLSMGIALFGTPLKSHAILETMTSKEALDNGFSTADGVSYYLTKTQSIGQLTGAHLKYNFALPQHPVFSSSDVVAWGTMDPKDPTNGIVSDVTLDAVKGIVTVTTKDDISGFVGKTAAIIIVKDDVLISDSNNITSESGGNAKFTYTISLTVVEETSPDAITQMLGWRTNDSGKTYAMFGEPYVIGATYTDGVIPVPLPLIAKEYYYDEEDIIPFEYNDISSSIISGTSISGNILYLLTTSSLDKSLIGKSASVKLEKTLVNEKDIEATYTFSVRVDVSHLSDATVNDKKPDTIISVTKGANDSLKCANVGPACSSRVVWCSNKFGEPYTTYDWPRLSSKGTVDVSRLDPGTYYFYFESGDNIRSDLFTLEVNAGKEPEKKPEPTVKQSTVYRLLNPKNNEHLYTASKNEVDKLEKSGWQVEPSPGKAVSNGDVPVYRLFNRLTGEHLYTPDKNECKTLVRTGIWEYDNEGKPIFKGTSDGKKGMYRLNNPWIAAIASHHYTSDKNEVDKLTGDGWILDNKGQPYFYLK